MMETHCTDLKDNTLRTANSIRVGRHQEIKQEEEEAKIVLENDNVTNDAIKRGMKRKRIKSQEREIER